MKAAKEIAHLGSVPGSLADLTNVVVSMYES